MSLRGYWRTLIVRIACKPAIRITKLTTSASTGRLMKRSVKDFMRLLGHSERSEAESKNPAALPWSYATGSLDFARDDNGQFSFVLRALSLASRIDWVRIYLRVRRE